jgi:hypothetical protein
VLDEGGSGSRGPGGDGDGSAASDPDGSAAIPELKSSAQIATGGSGELPFTGYLAIPALALSLILASTGAVILRRVRRGEL